MKLTPRFFENVKAKRNGRYAQVGLVRMYYEIYGRGEPLFWLHGGLSCIDGLRFQIPFFAPHFKVILPERPGHGHTADLPGHYSYEQMAEQTLALMQKLGIKKASFAGYSDGANLLLWLAAKHSTRVRKIVLVGGNFHHRGCEVSFQKQLKQQKIRKKDIDSRYAAYSPDGAEHYLEVFSKCRRLWLTEPQWKENLLRKIRCPALVLAGDRDMIKPEHTLALFRGMKKAQLALIPGASHALLKEKPEIANPIILNFLKS